MNTPLSEDEIKSLKIGDIVYISGIIYIARDEAHLRALEYQNDGKKLPVDFNDGVIFHCGPIVDDQMRIVAAGPTTSARMNSLEPDFIKEFGIRAIIGKGGMSQDTVDAMKNYGCVYLSFTGGAAVLAAQGLKKVSDVHWMDLGMPEALWVIEAENFGPLVVSIDAFGHSIYNDILDTVKQNVKKINF